MYSPLTLKERLDADALPRPHYAYGTYHAARQAKALGLSAISVIEFGVAAGSGLIELEKVARQVSSELDIDIQVYGFDTAVGMPEALGYKDLPYVWEKGYFQMDVEKLQSKLSGSQLILGDVAETVTSFVETHQPAPIGFISFDLDYYSSTVDAFALWDQGSKNFLPRVYCYFDDCLGDDGELHSKFTGELLAIEEFNQAHESIKIAQINGFRHKRRHQSWWNDVMYICHHFEHEGYCKNINPKEHWDLPMESSLKDKIKAKLGA